MMPDTFQAIDARPAHCDCERARRADRANAERRFEAVLRILKDRSTVVEEAVRMNVDVDTVIAWLAATSVAISRALAHETAAATHRNGGDPRVTQRHLLTV